MSTARFEDYFESWPAGHKPFIDPGTWNDYRTHGITRLIPEFVAKRLDEIATSSQAPSSSRSIAASAKPQNLNAQPADHHMLSRRAGAARPPKRGWRPRGTCGRRRSGENAFR